MLRTASILYSRFTRMVWKRTYERNKKQQLTIRVAQSFCQQWLLPRLADFIRQHPDVCIKILILLSAVILYSSGILVSKSYMRYGLASSECFLISRIC